MVFMAVTPLARMVTDIARSLPLTDGECHAAQFQMCAPSPGQFEDLGKTVLMAST
jgi:hypothetical protein